MALLILNFSKRFTSTLKAIECLSIIVHNQESVNFQEGVLFTTFNNFYNVQLGKVW